MPPISGSAPMARPCSSSSPRMPMLGAIVLAPFVALAGALLFGWFAVRLSGVYLAMLTLAFAQIVWSIVFQWENVTGGSNGVVGIWPTAPFNTYGTYYLLTLVLRGGQHPAVAPRCCSRRSAMRCGPAATRRCAPRRSASTSSACTGSALPSPAAICGIAGGAVRLCQGLDLAGNHRGRPLDRRPGHGAARRHPDAERADRRRRRLHAAAGHHHAAGRILARAARRHHPAAGAGLPRRPDGLVRQIRRRMESGADERARRRYALQVLRRRACRRSRQLHDRRRRVPGADRPERRGQIDLLQHDQRPAPARQRPRAVRGPATSPARRRARSGGSASAAPFRSPRPSAR